MVLLTNIIVRQIQIRLLCNLYTGMTENLAEGKNIHAVHKAPFGKIVSQTMGCVFLVQSGTQYVFFEIAFKVADTDRTPVFLDREQIITFHIPVLKLEPPPQNGFCFGREVHCPVFPSLCFFGSEVDTLSCKLQIRN